MATLLQTRKILSSAMIHGTTFKRGNIHAEMVRTGYYVEMGQLPHFLKDQLKARIDPRIWTFVIYSYKTPIAWATLDENGKPFDWFIPEVHYSVTTTHHQHLVRVEVSNPGFYAQFR